MPTDEDPLLWLEHIDGDKALHWVKEQNRKTVTELSGSAEFAALEKRLRAILDSDARIPLVAKRDGYLYNFWRDADHPKGIWRRTTLDDYRNNAPAWDTIIDVDQLAKQENENWVWGGARSLPPTHDRCLIILSRGGADATVTREFDLTARRFIEPDIGFTLDEAKGHANWIDRDQVYVATDFGDGSMTASGYPRITKRWTRGTPLADAETVFAGEHDDMSISAFRDHTPGYQRDFVHRQRTFYTNELYQIGAAGLVKIDKPDDATAFVFNDHLIIELRSDWALGEMHFSAGSLLASDYQQWLDGRREPTTLFAPNPQTSLPAVCCTRHHLVLTILDKVKSRIEVQTPGPRGWVRSRLAGLPELGEVSAWPVDADHNDQLWLSVADYITPSSLWLASAGTGPIAEKLKQAPAFFNADGLRVTQHEARSDDGTMIPYFQIAPADLATHPEPSPTLLYGYGGFEISLLPNYLAVAGAAWLERGGVYVVANIRGGGEFGPRWHQAALRENRHRAYQDFAAVGQDLLDRGVTTTAKLGIQGGSNGGLLIGNMLTGYPQLWGAAVCQVPLLDMRRYTQLLAGASWAAEYGDPDDPEQWAFIKTFSPYHNIDPDADYPPILFTTSTRDDRVHPGHARKMACALLEAGKDVSYYENIEGGHGGAADNAQQAFIAALIYTFLWCRLADTD